MTDQGERHSHWVPLAVSLRAQLSSLCRNSWFFGICFYLFLKSSEFCFENLAVSMYTSLLSSVVFYLSSEKSKQTKSNPRVLLRRESCAACEDLKLGSRNYTKSGVVITSVSPMCDYSSFCPFSGFIHIAPAKTYCVLCIFPPICYKLM